jgi:hypothetical protein
MSNSQTILPLIYFQDLLEKDKSKSLIDSFISDFIENSGCNIISVDNTKGEIKYFGQHYEDEGPIGKIVEITHDFKSYFAKKIEAEVMRSKSLINEKVNILMCQNLSNHEFLISHKTILSNLEPLTETHYLEYPFVKDAISSLSNYLAQFSSFGSYDTNHSYKSFCWDSDNIEERTTSLIKLHNLLSIENKIIDVLPDEFIRAFSNGEVKEGIKWLHTGKNKSTSITSILYFINQLQEQNFILDYSTKDYNDRIVYVFRDNEGNILKNIRQSKYTLANKLYKYDFLDNIIIKLP